MPASAPRSAQTEALTTPTAQALRLLASDWTILYSQPDEGARNMAVDFALLSEAQTTGRATLRLYGWSSPTLSLGRHERAVGRFDPNRLQEEGIAIVRRPTGGRALLHGPELTYSITAPAAGAALRWRYGCINALLADALRTVGVETTTFRADRHSRPGTSLCFSEPSSGELAVNGAKLVASAQLEERAAFLQHGSLLLRDTQPVIARLVGAPDLPGTATQATALEAILQRPVHAQELADALTRALRRALGPTHVTSVHSTESLFADNTLTPLIEQFRSPAWTWSR